MESDFSLHLKGLSLSVPVRRALSAFLVPRCSRPLLWRSVCTCRLGEMAASQGTNSGNPKGASWSKFCAGYPWAQHHVVTGEAVLVAVLPVQQCIVV